MKFFKPFKLIFIVTINLSLLPVPVGIGIFSAEVLHQSFNINKKTFGKGCILPFSQYASLSADSNVVNAQIKQFPIHHFIIR